MRTYWRKQEEQKDDIEREEEPEEWWEDEHVGYLNENDHPEFEWDEEFLRSREDVDGTNDKEDDGEEHEHGRREGV